MKKIDIHSHATYFPDYVQKFYGSDDRYMSSKELIAFYEKIGIDIGVLLPDIEPSGGPNLSSNEEVKTLTVENPERFLWYCNVDPRAGMFSPETDLTIPINHYKKLGAKGIGELSATLYADDPMMDNLFGAAEECEMPVLFHIAPQIGGTYGVVDDLGLPRFEKMFKKHPKLKFIGHSAAFWSEISEGVAQNERNGYPKGKVREGRLALLMREYGNLCCDLSAGSGANAMMRDREYAAKFLTEFSDRIYYGTDVCSVNGVDFAFNFDNFLTSLVEEGDISRETYEKIIRLNAVKLLGLEK